MYMRRCRRCENFYKTGCKHSKFCQDCKKPWNKNSARTNSEFHKVKQRLFGLMKND